MQYEMKDSGVGWIGMMPEKWEKGRIKYNYYLKGRIGWQGLKADEFIDDGPYYLITGTDFDNGRIAWERCYRITEARFQEAPEIHVKIGDLLITKDGTVGKVAYIDHIPEMASLNSHLLIMRPIVNQYSNKYLFWVIQSSVFEKYCGLSQNGSIMASLSQEKMSNFAFPLPSSVEQEAIAAYLDEKCAVIDGIIAEAKASIDEYKTWKASVIFEAVTKGLDPNAEMKDSGVEWIGKIPKHWEQRRIKTLFALRNEKSFLPLSKVNLISLYTEKGVVQHSDLEETTGNKASNADGYKKVYENDIVVNIILCWMGAIGRSSYNGVTSPAYDVYRPLNITNSKFYHYYFRTPGFNGECYKRGKGIMAMRWRTYSDQFMSIKVAYPPVPEQAAIAAYLDEKCATIDGIIAEKESLITELETYKKSLIFETVTGKGRVC